MQRSLLLLPLALIAVSFYRADCGSGEARTRLKRQRENGGRGCKCINRSCCKREIESAGLPRPSEAPAAHVCALRSLGGGLQTSRVLLFEFVRSPRLRAIPRFQNVQHRPAYEPFWRSIAEQRIAFRYLCLF